MENITNKKQQPKTDTDKEVRVGQGFSDTRGDSYRQPAEIPKHNGLNVNNDPTNPKVRKTVADSPKP